MEKMRTARASRKADQPFQMSLKPQNLSTTVLLIGIVVLLFPPYAASRS